MPTKFSFSAYKNFASCPRKYYHLNLIKDYKQDDTPATSYGTRVHLALENYLLHGTSLPPDLLRYKPFVDSIANVKGERFVEHPLGVRADFSPCAFDDPEYWWHGIPDVLIVNGATAHVVDWKTSKNARYADTDQLELLAAATMAHFPEVNTVKGGLIFLVANDFVQDRYTRDDLPQIWSKWVGRISQIDAAKDANKWSASPSGLCGWCPVTGCEHHRSR